MTKQKENKIVLESTMFESIVVNHARNLMRTTAFVGVVCESFKKMGVTVPTELNESVLKTVLLEQKLPDLLPDEKALLTRAKKLLKEAVAAYKTLVAVSVKDPVDFGNAVENLVELSIKLKDADNDMTKLMAGFPDAADSKVVEQFAAVKREIFQFFSMAVYRLTEAYNELKQGLEKMTHTMPSGYLAMVRRVGAQGYVPDLKKQGLLKQLGGFFNLDAHRPAKVK